MNIPNIFQATEVAQLIDRINMLSPSTKPLWGKMYADQMLAHVNVAYEMAFEDLHPKPKGFKKLILKLLVKKAVTGPKAYSKNTRTAPVFIIKGSRDFEVEQKRLITYLNKVLSLGREHFEQLESHGFGPLSSEEWNTLFAKHLEHHLQQFGV
jgi:hypothetical protein